jgi:hypothetical protein
MGAAANLFFQIDPSKDTLNKRVRPSDAQINFLREKKDDLEAHLVSDLSARCDCKISTWIQGSYKFHTLIRPINRLANYDVDIGVYFEWGDSDGDLYTNSDVRRHVQSSIHAHKTVDKSVKEIVEPPKERCSRAIFAQQFHIDLPVYHHHIKTKIARLATLNNGWELSDPEKMVAWFHERLDGDERKQVRRLTRYLKTWAALRFSENTDARPSSLFLTVLAVDAYLAAIDEQKLADDDALYLLVREIDIRLRNNRRVENPVQTDQDRDLNRLTQAGFAQFMDAFGEFLDVADRATDCEDEAEAAMIWIEAFDYLFPLPDIVGIAEENELNRNIVVTTPEIRIELSNSEGGSVSRNYTGQVDFARVNEWLRFRITNHQSLPRNAVIRWVVRNVGDEAYQKNDLGHSAKDDGSFFHDEKAAYIGRHFMDCEVRVNGRLKSVTRVPVQITSLPIPPRHPPRPSYVKFRGGRKR